LTAKTSDSSLIHKVRTATSAIIRLLMIAP
jgi:hypothetical protein